MQKILTAEEIAAQAISDIPALRLPDRAALFRDRAARLRQLSPGHSMGDYLNFIAEVADVQQSQLDDMPPVALPDDKLLQLASEHGMPPLNIGSHKRDPIWHDMLRRMLRALANDATGVQLQVITKLEGQRGDFYEAQASKLLAAIPFGLDLATAPLIGAALQVYWTHLVAALGLPAFAPLDVKTVCPCCGSRPTTSVTRTGAGAGNRYLHCALCAAEWHLVRITCTRCEETRGIHYLAIENGSPAVKAECCDECGTYLKILYVDKDGYVEPVADDLASIALDLLVTEAGKVSSGVNLMLIQGDDES